MRTLALAFVVTLAPAAAWAQTAPQKAPAASSDPSATAPKPAQDREATKEAAPEKPPSVPPAARKVPQKAAAPDASATGDAAESAAATGSATDATKASDQGADEVPTAAPSDAANEPPPGAAPEAAPEHEMAPRVLPPQPGAAPLSEEVPPPDEPSQAGLFYSGPLGYHQDHLFMRAGIRVDLVRDPGFDVFASNDALTQFGVDLGSTFLTQGDLSVAALLGWDYGSRSDALRDTDETSLGVHRLGAGIEARYHLIHRLYFSGGVRAGAARLGATLSDKVAQVDYVSNHWLFAGRAALGVAFELFGKPDGSVRRPRAWFVADGGYALTNSAHLNFAPDHPNQAPERAQPVALGDVNLSGATLRFGAAVSY